MLSTESDLYDPLQYNMGTVWPFVTGFAAWAQYRYRRPWAGFHLMDAVKRMTFHWALGRHPELLSGSFYQPLDQTVPHQFFATSMLATPLLRGVFGWQPDAPLGRARLAPQLPPGWPAAAIRGLRAGSTVLDVEIRQNWTSTGGEQRATVHWRGPRLDLDFVPDVPVGARNPSITVDGVPAPGGGVVRVQVGRDAPGPGGAEPDATDQDDVAEIVVRWEGGLEVAPPRIDLEPGQRSTGLRIIDLVADDDGWLLTLEGTPGRDYDVELFGTPIDASATDAAASVSGQSDGTVRVSFTGEGGRVTTVVRLSPGA
ncbi:MAG: hypothetical protein F4179_14445 [Gammaproteobacteria bacterium]|nr:hypothetical protein [Gammaproteobacteria bacterium]